MEKHIGTVLRREDGKFLKSYEYGGDFGHLSMEWTSSLEEAYVELFEFDDSALESFALDGFGELLQVEFETKNVKIIDDIEYGDS